MYNSVMHKILGVILVGLAAVASEVAVAADEARLKPFILGTAPGGIAEMAITAKVLRVGVAFVTAAHVMRFVIVMLFTEPAYRLIARRRERGARH